MVYTETNYENAVIELFRTLEYKHVYAPNIVRDYAEPLFMDELVPSLCRINSKLPRVAIDEAIYKLRELRGGNILRKNKQFMDYLQNGIEVNFHVDGKQYSDRVRLVDYSKDWKKNNSFVVANQWTMLEHSEKRPDIIIFLNGLPIVIIELKSPSREDTDASEAYLQLRNYMHEIPSLFSYNAFLVMSDMALSKAGTITSGEDRFAEWKTKDGSYENTQYAQFDTFFESMFDKGRLLDIIKNFICFSNDKKILGGYHQYFAVNKAVASTINATKTDGRGGVFWHTQGSGKSLSMVFYTRLLQDVLESPTVVVLTDRNDLDDQLFSQFSECTHFLRQAPQQAESREHLKQLLVHRQANGIIFTTAQKFEESSECLSDRKNIIVIADEAHRSQFVNESVSQEGKIKKSYGLIIRESLPNATYIGFTGTPINSRDRSTREVFGDYIDIYDMTQAVEDQATRPVYYESRVIKLKLDQDILRLLDSEYEIMAMNAEASVIAKSKKELSRLESILGADQTVTALCDDIIRHYEETRANELTGKAMIVAYSRPIAMKIYRKIMTIRPNWKDKVGVVMTSDNQDPEDWHEVIGNKRHKDEMAKRFKDDNDTLKIAIVVDMWLTGFDVPSLSTMYIYKQMIGHNLMQAIARVNRVYKNKEGGLVVDYVGIAGALKQAMNDYTKRDKNNFGEQDIAKTAYPKFIEKMEVCRGLFHGFNYSEFLNNSVTDLVRARVISGGLNFLSDIRLAKKKELFIREALLLRQSLSLCRSLITPQQRFEAAYFEAVRTLLTRITRDDKPLTLKEINARVNELLKASIQSDGVINLFSDVRTGFSLFDPKFLEEISRMKERNLVVEILKKLLAEQVSLYKRTNLIKSEKFSEMLARAMKMYINGLITNEEVIAELMNIANEMTNAHKDGDALGLTEEELAFYDALTKPQGIKDCQEFKNGELVALTQELADTLRRSRTIDWQKKETARADMRRIVKRLLKKYKYPPEAPSPHEYDNAIDVVLSQCELWTDN